MTQGLESKNMCIFAGTIVQSKRHQNGFTLQHLPNGSPKLEINLLIEKTFTGRDGQQKSNKAYIDVTVWGQKAQDIVSQLYLGAFVEVVCEYSKRYVKERNTTYHTFTANKVEVKGGMPQQPQQQMQPPQQPMQAPNAYPQAPAPGYAPAPQQPYAPQGQAMGQTQQSYTAPQAPPQQVAAPIAPMAPPPLAPPPPMNTPVQAPVQTAPQQAPVQETDGDIPF